MYIATFVFTTYIADARSSFVLVKLVLLIKYLEIIKRQSLKEMPQMLKI